MPQPFDSARDWRVTRDKLAAQARERDMSLAALLAQLAREQELEAIFESERQAVRAEAQSPAALELILALGGDSAST
jgi:hypothetical protein